MTQLRELHPGDAELVEGLKRGEDKAFTALLARYQGKVYRLAMTMTRNPQDAEEVTQAFTGRSGPSTGGPPSAPGCTGSRLTRRS